MFTALDSLEVMGVGYEILFLEASDETLVRRFKETRRRHPLSAEGGIIEGGLVKNVENLRRFARKLPVSSIRRILLRNSFANE